MIKSILGSEISKTAKKLFKKEMGFAVEKDDRFADYASNVALVVGGSPRENAEKIKTELEKSKTFSALVSRTEVAGPGFLNFWVKEDVFVKNIGQVLKEKDKYGFNKSLKGKKIVVEFTDPNPFKEFHIGHLMSNSIGEFVARILESSGAQVKRACYQGDVGLHVAKTVADPLYDKKVKWKNVVDLGKSYAVSSKRYELDSEYQSFVKEINKKIYEGKDKNVIGLYRKGREWSLKYFESVYDLLGMKAKKGGKHFDFYFFESETGKHGKKIVDKFLKKGVFAKSEGAIVFPEEKSGLHTRVFINSEGLPTYEAKELGLAEIKYGKYKYNTSIVVTGNEINEYFKVLLKAMEFVFPKLAKNTKHLSHGMLRLPTGKMSSRTGDVITATGLLGDIEEMVLEKIADRNIKEKEKIKTAKQVALAAIKYSILKQSPGGDVIFDFEKSISFEGDSGPYIQYAYVRTQSILNNAKEAKIKELVSLGKVKDVKISPVEKLLAQFPEVIEKSSVNYAPNYISTYLIELCHAFNAYYAENKIVTGDDTGKYRIALTKAVGVVIKNGLNLLGIPAPEKM